MQAVLPCASFSGWNSFQNTLEAVSQWCCYRGDSKPWEKALRGGHRNRHSELCFTYTSVIWIYFMQHCCNCWSYKCKLLNSTDNSSAQKAKQFRRIFSLFSFYLITSCQRAQENFLCIVFFFFSKILWVQSACWLKSNMIFGSYIFNSSTHFNWNIAKYN